MAAIRVRLGVSQARMAELTGRSAASQSDIGKLEKGTLWKADQGPNVRLLMDIAGLVDERVEYFQDGGPTDTERRDKLITAEWMEKMARQLREEAAILPGGDLERAKAERAGEATEEVREAEKSQPTRRPGGASGRKRRTP